MTRPDTLAPLDAIRLRAAAHRAAAHYPAPVADYLTHELRTWEQLGMRLDLTGRAHRLVTHLLTLEPPS